MLHDRSSGCGGNHLGGPRIKLDKAVLDEKESHDKVNRGGSWKAIGRVEEEGLGIEPPESRGLWNSPSFLT
jgi:hypothetical protein